MEATDDVSEEQPARTEPSAAPTNADSSKVDFASDDSRLVQVHSNTARWQNYSVVLQLVSI